MIPLYKSYLKLALRHSWKNKWSVLVNIIGLGVALSMCIFVYTIYAYNIEFDSFYKDTDNIYRINSFTFENGHERRSEITPFAMDNVLENNISGVQQVSGVFDGEFTIKKGNDYFEQHVEVVSGDFFEMFDIPLWYGSLEDFKEKPLVYLSKDMAKKLYGNEVALGETLTIYPTSTRSVEVTVAGVFERVPLNSSFDFDLLMSEETYFKGVDFDPNSWYLWYFKSHYVRTSPNAISTIIEEMEKTIPLYNEGHPEFKITGYDLMPFASPMHSENYLYRKNTNARLKGIVHIIFTSLAAMIFLIACFNLANSSMAMIARRLKEIGIRKTLGSENRQIMTQFIIEMGIVCFFALIIGLSMINYTSTWIMGLFGQSFLIKDVNLFRVAIFLIVFLTFTTLMAGLMPAIYAWKFHPVAIMRKSVKLKGIGWVSKTLTVAQYSFSIAVLAAAVTFTQNQDFMDDLDLGYANDDVYALSVIDDELYPAVKQKISQLPGIQTVGTFNHVQYGGRTSNRRLLEIDTSSYELRTYRVGAGYLDLMNVPIIQGRAFIEGSEADEESIIVNQEFVKQYFDNEDPINEVVKIDGERKTIVGIYKNMIHSFHSDSEERPAAFMYSNEDAFPYLIAKVDGGDMNAIEDQFKTIWSETTDNPYEGNWQRDLSYGSATRDSENLRIIFFAMAIIGGILSIAGIFSQAKLNVSKKLKEISIRKVLGSSINQLFVTINKPFYIVLSISLIIGGALGYLIADQILAMIYKIYVPVSPMTSLISGVFIVAAAVLIICFSIAAPAKSNPVVGLREE